MKSFKIFVKRLIFILITILLLPAATNENKPSEPKRMQWFKDAKLGIFIHWGIYSVKGISESWSFHNGHISYEDYMQQLQGFTASKWNPDQWAELIKESGAKYTVITTKHHDGVALWPTNQDSLSIPLLSPVNHRDLIGMFAEAVRKQNIKLGFYFSLLDWSHPDYPNFTNKQKRYKKDSVRHNRFVKYNFAQINELEKYHPDLWWFDGDWEQSAEWWHAKELRETILKNNPDAIINSRLQGYGDYATPELGLPVNKPKNPYWELCITTNESWGYQPQDTAYKTVNETIGLLVNCIGKGGNLLLDIGPRADGTIPGEQVEILKGLGRWVHKHSEAVYGTIAGIPCKYFDDGITALSKDKKTLFLYIHGNPSGSVLLKGINNKIKNIRLVGNDTPLSWKITSKPGWSKYPGLLYISIPEDAFDKDYTVVAVELDKETSLYND